MGTRNLTIVVQNQEVKVAQYGQWDGYPEGQGMTILNFLKNPSKLKELKQTLPKVRFQNEGDIRIQSEFMNSIGSKDGWMNVEQAKKMNKEYPLHHRDVGGEILEDLLEFKELPEIVLIDSYAFAADSLWCEWAYVVDLDKNIFEIYHGLNQSKLSSEDRFYSLTDTESNYFPVKIIQSFSLENLPEDEEFILLCRHRF